MNTFTKTILAVSLIAASFSAQAADIHIETYGHDRYGSYAEFDTNLPFMVVRNYVENLYPSIDPRFIMVDLVEEDVWQVTIVMSKSTKVFNVILDKKL